MSRQISDRLRAAYEAKADQVTAERLDQLAARRQQSLVDGDDGWQDRESSISLFDGAAADLDEPAPLDLDHRPAGTRHARWLAPALAAAAVAAIAVAVTAVATSDHGRPTPHPPATQGTSPSPSSSPSASASPSDPASTAVAGPPYLPRGQQGTRSQVPWSAVGAGWRLLKPSADGGDSPTSLYLYDPAGGRYLITDQLPAKAGLLAWSPDGARAMVGNSEGYGSPHYQEIDLRSGKLSTGFTRKVGFIGYTQPKGLAVIVQEKVDGVVRLARYSTTGRLEHVYATDLPGLGKLDAVDALYLPDGGTLVSAVVGGPLVLLSNDGRLVRTYELPKGVDYCTPIKRWTDTSVLERCMRLTGSAAYQVSLYLQPVSGGAPTQLTTAMGWDGKGYFDAWPLSNGHVLLRTGISCGTRDQDILLGIGGSTRPFRWPAGLVPGARMVNVDGDRATFEQPNTRTCGDRGTQRYELIDYNLVTGALDKLVDGPATLISWPGGES